MRVYAGRIELFGVALLEQASTAAMAKSAGNAQSMAAVPSVANAPLVAVAGVAP